MPVPWAAALGATELPPARRLCCKGYAKISGPRPGSAWLCSFRQWAQEGGARLCRERGTRTLCFQKSACLGRLEDRGAGKTLEEVRPQHLPSALVKCVGKGARIWSTTLLKNFCFFFFFLKKNKQKTKPTTPNHFESSFDFSKDRV